LPLPSERQLKLREEIDALAEELKEKFPNASNLDIFDELNRTRPGLLRALDSQLMFPESLDALAKRAGFSRPAKHQGTPCPLCGK
jgi:hypothetical protein